MTLLSFRSFIDVISSAFCDDMFDDKAFPLVPWFMVVTAYLVTCLPSHMELFSSAYGSQSGTSFRSGLLE